ncbi:PREDICTED: uncharacterized protein LOC109189053 isoform X1 [Ipomoea nil]|uniref:uncharacterized protein LOC109189053 isoform X1 n=1 Tax=Ipomoea nil TaxID=35883 RepID=UPI000901DF12|nr:PREDICTED: uncharacterized protein LOC109189053 isoform X1 [Ipomoea nil]
MGPSAVRSLLNLPAGNRGGNRKPAAPVLYSQPVPRFKSNRTIGTAFASKRNGSMSAMCAQTKIQEFIEPADRKCKGWIHFVGVGGCGLSALAMLALKQGFEVSGSDIIWSSYMDPLHEAGARLYIGHSEFNLLRNDGSSLPDAVVVSSAIPVDNVEILHAKARRVPVYKRGAWLGKITEGHNLIAVSGSHGKSTTASMLAYLLRAMGDDITAVVGAKVPQFDGGNIIYGTSNNFVLEADEYDYCFLGLRPHIAVVTNVDWEHVDIFQNEEEVRATFRQFVQQIRDGGHLILCGDSCAGAYISLCSRGKADTEPNISNEFETFPSSELCCDRYHITTYGISSFNDWHASSIHPNSYGGSDYKLYHKGHYVADISLRMPGIHNIINSLAVIATVSIVARDNGFFDTITSLRSHLLNFRGICRRFEKVGTICGCHIYDDYAHHPTEIRAVLQAARQRFPFTELLVIFQPHTYSRIAALKSEFAAAFKDADQVVVTEVYAARETSHCTSGSDLARSIVCPSSEFIPSLDRVLDKLVSLVWEDPDREILILTLGAGDITTLGRKLLCELQLRFT